VQQRSDRSDNVDGRENLMEAVPANHENEAEEEKESY